MLTSGADQTADALTRLGAYVSQLTDYPAACFTERSLKAAGRHFEYFPKMKPLCDFLDAERGRLRETSRRCKAIASGEKPVNAPDPKDYRPPTEEEKAQVAELVKSFHGGFGSTKPWGHNELWDARMWNWTKHKQWFDTCGPKPGHPGCEVPGEVLQRWGM